MVLTNWLISFELVVELVFLQYSILAVEAKNKLITRMKQPLIF